MSTISKSLLLATAIGLTTLLGSGASFADSPHFINDSDSINDAGALVAAFKEAGLGSNENITYTLSADASATCNCVTKKGNCPSAANKQVITEPVSQTGSFSSGKNGSITASLQAGPPTCGASSPPTCPGGQTLTLVSVTYSDITLEDDTNGISAPDLTSPLSRTFFSCPK